MTDRNSNSVIVLEFNELCPNLMKDFINQGLLPNFAKLHNSSVVMTTNANELPPQLEPWVQWVTVHSGLSALEHNIFNLGEGHKLRAKEVATILSDHGRRVGILGSMNTNYRDLNGFFIPDPWDIDGIAEPKSLQPFHTIVAKQVQDSSTSNGISMRDLIAFGTFMSRHGLKLSTIIAGLKQLAKERGDSGIKWRRSMILEQLQFDLFRNLWFKYKPDFSTFFCNSTAHFQHYYWRNMEPDLFVLPPGDDDHPSLRTAILQGYRAMDALVGKFLTDFPNTRLVLLTALSQQPWRETTKCTFRPRDFMQFIRFAGIDPTDVKIKPVMAEEFHILCDESKREILLRSILAVSCNNKPVMKARIEDEGIFCGCAITDMSAGEGTIMHPAGRTMQFTDMFHIVHSMRSGRHHPHGLFWVQSVHPRVIREEVSLLDVAPTLLKLFDLEAEEHMTGVAIPIDETALATV
jgi:hypothetical protein